MNTVIAFPARKKKFNPCHLDLEIQTLFDWPEWLDVYMYASNVRHATGIRTCRELLAMTEEQYFAAVPIDPALRTKMVNGFHYTGLYFNETSLTGPPVTSQYIP